MDEARGRGEDNAETKSSGGEKSGGKGEKTIGMRGAAELLKETTVGEQNDETNGGLVIGSALVSWREKRASGRVANCHSVAAAAVATAPPVPIITCCHLISPHRHHKSGEFSLWETLATPTMRARQARRT